MIKNILGCEFKYEDDKMYRFDNKHKKWNCCNDNKVNNSGYIHIGINKKKYRLHRLIYKYHNEDWDITDISLNNLIDHKDINKTNNKIENLRILNHSQNQRNIKKRENCSSKYMGVSWNKQKNKWTAQIQINNKVKNLGYFDNEEEAREAYQIAYNELMNNI
jgi:hypothetical protein